MKNLYKEEKDIFKAVLKGTYIFFFNFYGGGRVILMIIYCIFAEKIKDE